MKCKKCGSDMITFPEAIKQNKAYFCKKCNRIHINISKIGKKHVQYKTKYLTYKERNQPKKVSGRSSS